MFNLGNAKLEMPLLVRQTNGGVQRMVDVLCVKL